VPRQRTRTPPSDDHDEHGPQSQEEHHQRRTPIGGATVQCRPGCRSAKQNNQLQEELDSARNEVHLLRDQSQLAEQELELFRTELNDCHQQVLLSEGECRNLKSQCELLKIECSNAEEDLNIERWSAREAVEETKQKSRDIAALRYENTQLLEAKLELEQKLEADHQVHVSLVMALQLDVKDSAMKYKVVRQELATAIAGWTSERERAVELQRKLHQVQPVQIDSL